MPQFRLNKHRRHSNENYEVHMESCQYYNSMQSFIDLGNFVYCSTAIRLAQTIGYDQVEGCIECCKECNTD